MNPESTGLDQRIRHHQATMNKLQFIVRKDRAKILGIGIVQTHEIVGSGFEDQDLLVGLRQDGSNGGSASSAPNDYDIEVLNICVAECSGPTHLAFLPPRNVAARSKNIFPNP